MLLPDIGNPRTNREILTAFREFAQERGALWVRATIDAEKVERFSAIPRKRMLEIMAPAMAAALLA